LAVEKVGFKSGNGTFAVENGGVAPGNGRFTSEKGTFAVENEPFAPENGGVEVENGTFAVENGRFAVENGGVALGNGTFTAVNGTFTSENGRFAAEIGSLTGKMERSRWKAGDPRILLKRRTLLRSFSDDCQHGAPGDEADTGENPRQPGCGEQPERVPGAEAEKTADGRADFVRAEAPGDENAAENAAEQAQNEQYKPHLNDCAAVFPRFTRRLASSGATCEKPFAGFQADPQEQSSKPNGVGKNSKLKIKNSKLKIPQEMPWFRG
jgi:hypothetical protein